MAKLQAPTSKLNLAQVDRHRAVRPGFLKVTDCTDVGSSGDGSFG